MAEPTGPTGPTSPMGPGNVKSEENYIEMLLQSAKQIETQNKLLMERAKLQKMTSEEFKLQLEIQAKTLDAVLNTVPALENIDKLEKSIAQTAVFHKEEIDAMLDVQRQAAAAANEAFDTETTRLAIIADITSKKQEELDLINKQHRAVLDVFDTTEDMRKLGDIKVKDGKQTLIQAIKEAKTEKEVRDLMLEAKGIMQQTEDLRSKLTRHAENYSQHLGMASNVSETSVGTFIDIKKQLSQAGKAGFGFGEMMGKAFGQSFNLLNVFASMVDIIKDMAIQLDSVGKSLGASTGMGNVFQAQIMTTFSATARGGGTMEESAAAIGSLASSFSKFDPEAEAVNESLATTVVRLGKIGVSSDTAAKTMDFFVRTLRMTEQQSADLTTELALMGQQMGMTATQITSDFQAVSSDLAVYGNNAINVFKDLEAQAKATGMQISALVTMAKQFDTFSQAADKAAQLNAVLGTQLSSLELMNMSYDERISYLRQEVSFSVGNMENLDQYTQQFIAQALGVGSVAEAQKFLNMSQAEYLKYQGDMAKSAKTQEDLAALTQELVPVMQQFKIALTSIALALEPLLLMFSGFIVAISAIINFLYDMIDNVIGKFVIGILAIAAAYIYYEVSVLAAILANQAFVLSVGNVMVIAFALMMVGKMLGSVFGEDSHVVTGFYALAAGVFAYGMAQKFAFSKTWMMVSALSALISVLGMRINPIFVAAFHFMSVGVTMLGAAFNTIQGPALIAMAVFALMVGMLALFVYSLKELIITLVDSGEGLFVAATGMYAIAGGITAIAGAMLMLGPMGMLGILVMANAMEKMGNGFQNTASGLERISKLSTVLSNLGNNGIIAVTSEGNKMTALMGAGDVLQNFNAGKIEVEVKLPDQKTPKIDLTVEILGNPIKALVKKVVGGAG
jgi:hypothetical protein